MTLKVLLFSILSCDFAACANLRVLFFNKTDEGAKFRIKCVQNPPYNRCNMNIFASKAKSLCDQEDLVVGKMDPVSCLEDYQTKVERCKYVNGICRPEGVEPSDDKASENKASENKKTESEKTTSSGKNLP